MEWVNQFNVYVTLFPDPDEDPHRVPSPIINSVWDDSAITPTYNGEFYSGNSQAMESLKAYHRKFFDKDEALSYCNGQDDGLLAQHTRNVKVRKIRNKQAWDITY